MTCPGCGFEVSRMEVLTGVCAKDGVSISEPRFEIVLEVSE